MRIETHTRKSNLEETRESLYQSIGGANIVKTLSHDFGGKTGRQKLPSNDQYCETGAFKATVCISRTDEKNHIPIIS